MRVRRQIGDKFFDIISMVVGVAILVIVLYPMYFVIIASFSSPAAVANGEVWFFPKNITFVGYQKIFEDTRIWAGYKNTILYTVTGTLISLAFTLPAAYSLSRKDLVGRNIIMMFFTVTMFFSGGLIPTYLTVNSFKLTNTFWVVVLPFSVSVYNLIVSRTFFATNIPQDLLEASQLDGCNNLRFFFQIVLPLSKAIVAVIAMYVAVGQWNQYFTSLIYVRDEALQPLQLVLRNILLQTQAMANANSMAISEVQKVADQMKYGIIIVSTLPIMCVYPFLQKYFTQGIMIGSIKG